MNVLSVNNITTSTSFRGLWEEGPEHIVGSDILGLKTEQYYYYHPFADESENVIAMELKREAKEISYPGASEYSVNTLKITPVLKKALSFTESEYKAYKNFYGKTLPESMKSVELGLKSVGLNKYLNKGLLYKMKQLLHLYR